MPNLLFIGILFWPVWTVKENSYASTRVIGDYSRSLINIVSITPFNSFLGVNGVKMEMEIELLRLVMDKYPSVSVDQATEIAGKLLAGISKLRAETAMGRVAASPGSGVSPAVAPSELKVSPKKAIQADKIVCCVCGFESKTLTKGHLAEHGLTRDAYLDMCGYAKSTKLMCRDQIDARKTKVRETKPWEKTKRWQEKQARMQREVANADAAKQVSETGKKDHSASPADAS